MKVKCFNAPLQPDEVVGVKKVVREKMPEGVNDRGLTLTGFLFLHALFIEKGRLETTWTVLRKFGYDNDIKLRDDLLPLPFKRAPDQSVELTSAAVEFLKGIFYMFDIDNDGALRPVELDDLFSTAPENPWAEGPCKDIAEKNVLGGLTLEGFLSEWALMTLLDPASSLSNLIYIGYTGDPAAAFTINRKRRVDRKKQQSQRNVVQCFVFGPKGAGKSMLLNSLIGRSFSDKYTTTTEQRFAANIVETSRGEKKTLVMREIPEDDVKKLLSVNDSLAPCDVAVFVHDSSDENSWKRTTELLVEVTNHAENNGFEMPCLVVSAKNDLDPYPMAVHDSTRVTQDLGIEMAIPVSVKLGELANIFQRIVNAGQQPHLGIPETEAGRYRKHCQLVFKSSLMAVSVGAALVFVGLAAYRVYAARKKSSG